MATNIAVEESGKKRVKWAIFRWQKSLRFGSDGKRKRVTGNIALERGGGVAEDRVANSVASLKPMFPSNW